MFGLSLTSTVDELNKALSKALTGQAEAIAKNTGYLNILSRLVKEHNAPPKRVLAMVEELEGDDNE